MHALGKNNEYLRIEELAAGTCRAVEPPRPDLLSFIWFRDGANVVQIDGTEYSFEANHVVFFTMLNRVEVTKAGRASLIQFNQAFHCLSQPGAAPSCRGGLFFGSTSVPAIVIPSPQVAMFELLLSVFRSEMRVGAGLQTDMLDVLLKRFLILSTRIRQAHSGPAPALPNDAGIIQKFKELVECHYSEKHTVAEYAEILNKSPKTLSNFFIKYQQQSPLHII